MPFTGGSQSGIPDVAGAGLFFDNVPLTVASFSPVLDDGVSATALSTLTGYPIAVREFWAFHTTQLTQAQCATTPQPSADVDPAKVPGGGITVGHADGHAHFLTVGQFLAKTPTQAELLPGGTIGASFPKCAATALSQGYGYTGTIDKKIAYPLWGFGN